MVPIIRGGRRIRWARGGGWGRNRFSVEGISNKRRVVDQKCVTLFLRSYTLCTRTRWGPILEHTICVKIRAQDIMLWPQLGGLVKVLQRATAQHPAEGEAGEGGRGQEDGGEGEAGILRHTLTPHLTSQLQSVSFKLFKQQCCWAGCVLAGSVSMLLKISPTLIKNIVISLLGVIKSSKQSK